MITPDEYNEIADLEDDLAFLTLEEKYRLSLNQRHPRANDEAHFQAILEYINHTTTAGAALGIEGSDQWESNLTRSSSQQNIFDALAELIGRVDRYIVKTRIKYARRARASQQQVIGGTTSIADNAINFGSTSTKNAFQEDAVPPRKFHNIVSGNLVESVGLAVDLAMPLLDESGRRLLTENGAQILVEIDQTSSQQLTHTQLQQSLDLLQSALLQWTINPGIGHNNPPDDFAVDIERDDIREIEHLVELLKSQPVQGNLTPQVLKEEIAKAGPVMTKLKSMGDSYLNKLAESAGTESGKLLSPLGLVAISITYYLGQVVQAASQWISTLPY